MGLRDLLILGIIFGAIPFVFYRPWLGILLWYWVGLMNPHRLAWGIAVNAPVAQVVAVTALAALLISRDRRPPPLTRETVLIILFAMHITVTTYFAWVPTAWEHWDRVMKILLMTLVTPMLVYGRLRITWLLIVVAVSIGFYGLKGGVFSVLTGGAHHVLGPSRSFISGNTTLGMALVMVLPLLFVLARVTKEQRLGIEILDRWGVPLGYLGYATFWLTAIATVFTYSRGALVGLACVVPFIYLKMRHRLALGLVAVLMAGTVIALVPDQLISRAQTIQSYEEDRSAMQRLQAWGVNWNMAVDRPFVGTGFHNAALPHEVWISYANWVEPWASTARAAHSIYFQVIGHHGFLGAGIYFFLMLFTTLTLMRIHRESGRNLSTLWMQDIAWALLVGLVGFFVAGAFLDMAYFTLIYVYVALAVIMRRELDEAEARVPGPGMEPVTHKPVPGAPAFPDFVPRLPRD